MQRALHKIRIFLNCGEHRDMLKVLIIREIYTSEKHIGRFYVFIIKVDLK